MWLTSDLAGNIPRCWGPNSEFFCILMIISSCPSRSASETCQNSDFTLDEMVHAYLLFTLSARLFWATYLTREHFSLFFHNIFRIFKNIFRKKMWIVPSNFSSDIFTYNFHVFFCTCLTIYPYKGVTFMADRNAAKPGIVILR